MEFLIYFGIGLVMAVLSIVCYVYSEKLICEWYLAFFHVENADGVSGLALLLVLLWPVVIIFMLALNIAVLFAMYAEAAIELILDYLKNHGRN